MTTQTNYNRERNLAVDTVNLRKFQKFSSETLTDVQHCVLVAIRSVMFQRDFCKCIETSQNVLPSRRRWTECIKFAGIWCCPDPFSGFCEKLATKERKRKQNFHYNVFCVLFARLLVLSVATGVFVKIMQY